MSLKPIAIASDHGGFELKETLIDHLKGLGHEILDLGCPSRDSVDYPDYGKAVGNAITDGRVHRGIIICGTGIGISIAANRNPDVRAALCQSGLAARLTRQHNDANVLALGARLIGVETALDCVNEFINTEFEGGRHSRRVEQLR